MQAVSWLPVGVAAAVVCDVPHCRARHLHLFHPRTTPFSALAVPLTALLDVPLVPSGTWVQRLRVFRAAQVQSEAAAAEVGLAGAELRALALIDFLARTDAASGEHALMSETRGRGARCDVRVLGDAGGTRSATSRGGGRAGVACVSEGGGVGVKCEVHWQGTRGGG